MAVNKRKRMEKSRLIVSLVVLFAAFVNGKQENIDVELSPNHNTVDPLTSNINIDNHEVINSTLFENLRFKNISTSIRTEKQIPEKIENEIQNFNESSDDYYDNYDYDYYTDDISDLVTPTDKAISDKKYASRNFSNKQDEENLTEYEIDENLNKKTNNCPRDCICQRNINNYMVATCSRLDRYVQHFGSDITDLVVVDVGPKYPIILEEKFFVKIGLGHISSIKISNCTIEDIHPTAFHGLTELYSLNLTNVGLTTINPDTFRQNMGLRLLVISGNDLSTMSRPDSVFKNYILKVPNLEELDISNNNIGELLPTAFTQLKNIVYINLAHNNLKNLPEKIFDSAETIEELNLSFNKLKHLPEKIFERTAISILNLRNNKFSNDIRFVTADVQHLDLSFCDIKHINNVLFKKMDGLVKLDLRGNGLRKIQAEAFLSLINLRHIDLSYNDLEQVSSLLFFKNCNLEVLKLNDNPRLNQLPLDGFSCHINNFNVHLLDVSNCAIGELGINTFSTMPKLTILNLAWNNINNLDRELFSPLTELLELDLSNNLIEKLDDFTFVRNHDLSKINLGGNPIKKLSAKLFFATPNLKHLDISDCELRNLLIDNLYSAKSNQFSNQLLYLNASRNQIKKISQKEIQQFKSLDTLDISFNPFKCTEEFRSLINWLNKSSIESGKVPRSLSLYTSVSVSVQEPSKSWYDLGQFICGKEFVYSTTYDFLAKSDTTTERYVDWTDDKADYNKDDSEQDNDDADVDEDYAEDYKDDSDDDLVKNVLGDQSLLAEETTIIHDMQNKILRGTLLKGDLDQRLEMESKTSFETEYQYVWPILLLLISMLVLVIAIGNIIFLLIRKRGERYRQALLASKSSIVYQKLSEDIITPRTGKLRYSPISQV